MKMAPGVCKFGVSWLKQNVCVRTLGLFAPAIKNPEAAKEKSKALRFFSTSQLHEKMQNLCPYLLEKAPPPIKRLPQLSTAYESKNIKERRPRISAAFINNNVALN